MNFEFTGERVIPGRVEPDLWNEHLARYAFAARLAGSRRPLRILDAGCGSGYGAAQLACLGPGVEVVGVDLSEEALAYARAHYSAPNLRFQQGDCLKLGFADSEYDLVVAFEVIEHLSAAAAFLTEARRVLSPSGRLLVSTPNRRYYSEERGYTNPFHTREYDREEFDALLAAIFPERAIFSQNHTAAVSFYPACRGGAVGSAGFAAAAGSPGGYPAGQPGAFAPSVAGDQPHFLVAIASGQALPVIEPFVFVPAAGNLLREREMHIRKVEQDLAAYQETTRRELDERKQWAEQQQAEIEARDQTIQKQQTDHEAAVAWGKGVETELDRARQVVSERSREIEERTAWATEIEKERQRLAGIVQELQAELDNKVAWAHSLEGDVGAAREALARLQQEFEERTVWALKLQLEFDERTTWALSLDADRARLAAELAEIFGSRWYRIGKKLRLSPVPPSDRGRGSGS